MARKISIADLANMVKGRVLGGSGEQATVTGTCAIDNYVKGRVSFIRSPKYADFLAGLKGAVVLIPESFIGLCEEYPQNLYIVVEDVVDSLMDIHDFFYGDEAAVTREGTAATASVDKSAKVGSHAYIGEHVCIGNNVVIGDSTKIMHGASVLDGVTIGNRTLIYPGVCIYHGCRIGNDCIIDAGAVIGGEGFRYEQFVERKVVRRMLHVGSVVIGDRVDIGANCAIDRATFEGDATIISDDVKIDNLVHIAHNAKIGARTLIVTQTCIGGSSRVGEDVWIGIGAAVSDNVKIGDRAKVLLNAVVAYDVPAGEMVSGFYAMPHKQWKQAWARLKGEA
jgi:UDP-3-O-[3-hydroxymyristoyl] glucosamine N-acyltransferase